MADGEIDWTAKPTRPVDHDWCATRFRRSSAPVASPVVAVAEAAWEEQDWTAFAGRRQAQAAEAGALVAAGAASGVGGAIVAAEAVQANHPL